MYAIDIKDALYFIVICVVVLEILGKMACFVDLRFNLLCKSFFFFFQAFISQFMLHFGPTSLLHCLMYNKTWLQLNPLFRLRCYLISGRNPLTVMTLSFRTDTPGQTV